MHVRRSLEVVFCARDRRRHIVYFASESSAPVSFPPVNTYDRSENPILVASHVRRNKPALQGQGNPKHFSEDRQSPVYRRGEKNDTAERRGRNAGLGDSD